LLWRGVDLCKLGSDSGKNVMRIWSRTLSVILLLAIAEALGIVTAQAQSSSQNLALKSGESSELHPVYWVVNCRSIVVGTPVIEVLEGPAEITLALKEGKVLPRRQNCANEVPGGTVVATAKDVTAPKQGKLTYRIKYKTKDGDRQTGHIYNVSLFP
jgi:hypothetical protein